LAWQRSQKQPTSGTSLGAEKFARNRQLRGYRLLCAVNGFM
jgi:hypothetical protein